MNFLSLIHICLGLGGSGLPVKPLILGLSGLIVPPLTADGLSGAVDAVGPEGNFQRLPPGAELEKALGLLALFFQMCIRDRSGTTQE